MTKGISPPAMIKGVWITSDNSSPRSKGQWHQWIQELYNFFMGISHR